MTAIGLVIIGLAAWRADGTGLALAVIAGVIVAAAGALGGGAVAAYRDLKHIPANCFGLCSGLGGTQPPALTP